MAKIRKPVPAKIKVLLQKEINSMCPLCDNEDVDHFEIHHIDEVPENNEMVNLLMLCPICHSKITKGDITKDQVIQVKGYLNLRNKVNLSNNRGKSISIKGNVVGSVVANTLSANTIVYKASKKPKIELAPDAIGSNAEMKNHVKHLIDRYNEFKESEIGKGNMVYSAIYAAIKKQFKASVFQVSSVHFPDLVIYMRNKIDNTRLGRINNAKGRKNYSEFQIS